INGKPVAGVQATVSGASPQTVTAQITLDGTVIPLGAGSYPITADFIPAFGSSYLASGGSGTAAVVKEDMAIQYTGQTFVSTTRVGGSTSVQASALVTESQDGYLGTVPWSSLSATPSTIIPLQVRFTLQNATLGTLQTQTVNVIQGSGGTGTATYSFLNLSANNYVIQVDIVTNNYYGDDSQSVAMTVTDPGSGFVTGGGWIADTGQSPTSTLGARDNFGFTVKFLKNGNIQGNNLFIYRTNTDLAALGVTGAPTGKRDYNFIIKSNMMDSLVQKP